MAKVKELQSYNGPEVKPLRVYIPADFPKIHARLAHFWKDGEFDRDRFLVDCGALSEEGAVIVENWRYEKNKNGESYGTCDAPSRLQRAYNLLEWYLPESKCYPNIRQEILGLTESKKFEVTPIENYQPMDEPF